jgi:hypothetical protein
VGRRTCVDCSGIRGARIGTGTVPRLRESPPRGSAGQFHALSAVHRPSRDPRARNAPRPMRPVRAKGPCRPLAARLDAARRGHVPALPRTDPDPDRLGPSTDRDAAGAQRHGRRSLCPVRSARLRARSARGDPRDQLHPLSPVPRNSAPGPMESAGGAAGRLRGRSPPRLRGTASGDPRHHPPAHHCPAGARPKAAHPAGAGRSGRRLPDVRGALPSLRTHGAAARSTRGVAPGRGDHLSAVPGPDDGIAHPLPGPPGTTGPTGCSADRGVAPEASSAGRRRLSTGRLVLSTPPRSGGPVPSSRIDSLGFVLSARYGDSNRQPRRHLPAEPSPQGHPEPDHVWSSPALLLLAAQECGLLSEVLALVAEIEPPPEANAAALDVPFPGEDRPLQPARGLRSVGRWVPNSAGNGNRGSRLVHQGNVELRPILSNARLHGRALATRP